MGLLDVVFVAKSFIQHISDLLDCLKVVVSQHMSEVDDQLTAIANNLIEILFVLTGNNLNKRCVDQTKQSINHWLRW